MLTLLTEVKNSVYRLKDYKKYLFLCVLPLLAIYIMLLYILTHLIKNFDFATVREWLINTKIIWVHHW